MIKIIYLKNYIKNIVALLITNISIYIFLIIMVYKKPTIMWD